MGDRARRRRVPRAGAGRIARPLNTHTVVLVEGRSDAAAVERLALRLGQPLEGVTVEAIGGVTNIRSALARLHGAPRVVGLCDAREVRYFERVLAPAGHPWFVCDADLEGEFIRALGVDATIRVITELGDLRAFEIFSNQPFQRDRSVEQRLHRFLGTMSGRKERYAVALVDALATDRAPKPLLDVLAYCASGS